MSEPKEVFLVVGHGKTVREIGGKVIVIDISSTSLDALQEMADAVVVAGYDRQRSREERSALIDLWWELNAQMSIVDTNQEGDK